MIVGVDISRTVAIMLLMIRLGVEVPATDRVVLVVVEVVVLEGKREGPAGVTVAADGMPRENVEAIEYCFYIIIE